MLALEIDRIVSKLADLARVGWAWWIAELKGMLPGRIVALLHARRTRILVDLDEGDIVLRHELGAECLELGRVAPGAREPDEIRTALAAALRRLRRAPNAATLRLPAAQALRRSLSLPAAAAKSLRQVLAHEFDRQMPLARDQAYYDCRIVSRDRAKGQITAELIAVRRGVIDGVLALAKACDLRLAKVELIGHGDPVPLPALLQPAAAARRSGWEWRLTAALGALAVMLGLGTLAALIDRQQSHDDALAQAVVTAQSRAGAAKQLQAKVTALSEAQQFLPVQKRSSSVMTVLNEVTRVLPDGAWLFDVEVRGKEVRLHGFAPEASSLLGRFAQSALFENARFRAPLTQGPHGGVERFELSLDFKGLP